mgnify:CR=1 FL=1
MGLTAIVTSKINHYVDKFTINSYYKAEELTINCGIEEQLENGSITDSSDVKVGDIWYAAGYHHWDNSDDHKLYYVHKITDKSIMFKPCKVKEYKFKIFDFVSPYASTYYYDEYISSDGEGKSIRRKKQGNFYIVDKSKKIFIRTKID